MEIVEDENEGVQSYEEIARHNETNLMKIAPRINSKGDVVFYTLALQWKNIH
jgi:hypothetical protein